MFNLLSLLIRGQSARLTEEITDRNAFLILDQQIRDAASAVDRARKAMAIAMAQDENEKKRLLTLDARIAALETRAIAALEGGRDDLAAEAAEAIAALETDRDETRTACQRFATESARLRQTLVANERRFAALERGRRMAQVEEATARLRSTGTSPIATGSGALRDAEATLDRLRQRQSEEAMTDAALDKLDHSRGPDRVSDKLESAGFGPASKPTAAAVLARLRLKTQAAA